MFGRVNFILLNNNVSLVPWGAKSVLLQPSDEVTLPKLTCKTPIYNIYVLFKELIKDDAEK